MRAYQCDRCGEVSPGSSRGFGDAYSYGAPAKGWKRPMDRFTVRLLIQPVRDPTGYGGMEICMKCRNELIVEALGVFFFGGHDACSASA